MITFDRGLISKMIVRYFTKKKKEEKKFEKSLLRNLNALSVIKNEKEKKNINRWSNQHAGNTR